MLCVVASVGVHSLVQTVARQAMLAPCVTSRCGALVLNLNDGRKGNNDSDENDGDDDPGKNWVQNDEEMRAMQRAHFEGEMWQQNIDDLCIVSEQGTSCIGAPDDQAPPVEEERQRRSPGLARNFFDLSTDDFKKPYVAPAGHPEPSAGSSPPSWEARKIRHGSIPSHVVSPNWKRAMARSKASMFVNSPLFNANTMKPPPFDPNTVMPPAMPDEPVLRERVVALERQNEIARQTLAEAR